MIFFSRKRISLRKYKLKSHSISYTELYLYGVVINDLCGGEFYCNAKKFSK